MAACTAV